MNHAGCTRGWAGRVCRRICAQVSREKQLSILDLQQHKKLFTVATV